MNIGSDGVRIEHQDTAVEFDYTNNQVIVESRKQNGQYEEIESFEQNKDSIERFVKDITEELSGIEDNSAEHGDQYRIEVLGHLGNYDSEGEVFSGKARTKMGIHEEDGLPEIGYRLWNEYSMKAKSDPVRAD